MGGEGEGEEEGEGEAEGGTCSKVLGGIDAPALFRKTSPRKLPLDKIPQRYPCRV